MVEMLPGLSVVLSLLVLLGYEVYVWRAARRAPTTMARSAHRLLRGEWVRVLSKQPGSEILAVQALRNSLMSATITASTAALILMGSVSLILSKTPELAAAPEFSLVALLELGLVLTLIATYICSAMAMR